MVVDSGATILRLSLNIVPRSVYQTKTVGQEIRARFYVKEMYSGCEVRQDEGSPGGSTNREVREAGSSLPVGRARAARGAFVITRLHHGSTVTQPYMPAWRCGRIPQTTR